MCTYIQRPYVQCHYTLGFFHSGVLNPKVLRLAVLSLVVLHPFVFIRSGVLRQLVLTYYWRFLRPRVLQTGVSHPGIVRTGVLRSGVLRPVALRSGILRPVVFTTRGSFIQGSHVQCSYELEFSYPGVLRPEAMLSGVFRPVVSHIQKSLVQGSYVQWSDVHGPYLQGSFIHGFYLLGSYVKGSYILRTFGSRVQPFPRVACEHRRISSRHFYRKYVCARRLLRALSRSHLTLPLFLLKLPDNKSRNIVDIRPRSSLSLNICPML